MKSNWNSWRYLLIYLICICCTVAFGYISHMLGEIRGNGFFQLLFSFGLSFVFFSLTVLSFAATLYFLCKLLVSVYHRRHGL